MKVEEQMKILVAGAGGFIGGHLLQELEKHHDLVIGVDLKPVSGWFLLPKKSTPVVADLRLIEETQKVTKGITMVFNLAADMGGMGFIENNKAKCMESVLINTHLLKSAVKNKVSKFFFASSACVYASWHQKTLEATSLKEQDAYPADPEDGYGWEKLFSERMCRHFEEDYGIETRVARYHNVYGPFGTFEGGREKVPAAACRKVIEAIKREDFQINIWGDGKQLRSFTYIDDCVAGTIKLMESNFNLPLNIGSSEMISIQKLYETIIDIAGYSVKDFEFSYDLNAPQGVRGRSSNNELCLKQLQWEPTTKFKDGIKKTYEWISDQLVFTKS